MGDSSVGMGKLYWVIIDLNVRRPHQNWVWPDWIFLTKNDLDKLTTILRQDDKWLWNGSKEIASCFQRLGKVVDTDEKGSNSSKIRLIITEKWKSNSFRIVSKPIKVGNILIIR